MNWLEIISIIFLSIGILSSLIILLDVIKHPQMMTIMNVVWPINGWFMGPFAIWAYFRWGRMKAKNIDKQDSREFPSKVFVSTTHCSAGCTAGDAIGVPFVVLTGITLMGSILFTHYIVEFILAYLFGILFQFFGIYPMSNKSAGKVLLDAIKADTLSLLAFEVGMFGWMAIVHYLLFTQPPEPSTFTFWFMMQIAMVIGFFTSYPANWWLVKMGIKEAM